MRTIVTVKNQTIFDIAVQEYGNADAWEEIISNNPGLKNDYSSALESGIFYYPDELDLAFPLMEGTEIRIDEESGLVNSSYRREMGSVPVISFDGID